MRFFILILLAILRYDILQYCSTNLVFLPRVGVFFFFFGTRNKKIRVLVFVASVPLLIFRNCRPIVLGHKRSGPGGIYVVLHDHLMDSFVERGVLFKRINKASRERAEISCGGRY